MGKWLWKVVIKKALSREQAAPFFAKLQPCLVGMEACGSAHDWARKLQGYGHTVKLMAPQFVKPYVKSNKNDARDAEAICEAVTRPNMRFVSIKTVEQQAILSSHRARQGLVKARTAQANQIRGLLAEYGIVINQGIHHLTKRVPEILGDPRHDFPGLFCQLLQELIDYFKEINHHIALLEKQIQLGHRQNEASNKLADIPGIDPLTVSAMVATIGDAKNFHNSRELAAWLGLVPRQYSSGGNLHYCASVNGVTVI